MGRLSSGCDRPRAIAGRSGSAKLVTAQYEDASHKPGFSIAKLKSSIHLPRARNRLKYFANPLKMEKTKNESSSKRYNSGNFAAN
ncbi:hypothetical protein IQ269_07580 [Tychonema sp. LEGE 07199]|uniref:hypothetical protein n=1 Tax=unclassified Tychonema TaxID=2642144 RepID=UPI00187F4C26|nr:MULTISPECIES: hypothetical protein [unclassified Tychonema]MBE9120681.1 hypothetical protein [Tychonema sp. LEGE 07199]MBE9132585.1 hypothetical protein [Tychonema sp. LEGE 07196]